MDRVEEAQLRLKLEYRSTEDYPGKDVDRVEEAQLRLKHHGRAAQDRLGTVDRVEEAQLRLKQITAGCVEHTQESG